MAMKSFSSRNIFINIDINSVSQSNGASNSCMRSSEVHKFSRRGTLGTRRFNFFFLFFLLYIERSKRAVYFSTKTTARSENFVESLLMALSFFAFSDLVYELTAVCSFCWREHYWRYPYLEGPKVIISPFIPSGKFIKMDHVG